MRTLYPDPDLAVNFSCVYFIYTREKTDPSINIRVFFAPFAFKKWLDIRILPYLR